MGLAQTPVLYPRAFTHARKPHEKFIGQVACAHAKDQLPGMRHHRDKAIVLLMLLVGLRKSEVLNPRLEDIQFGRRTLFVRDGKGGGQSTVAISDIGLQELLCHIEKERPSGLSDHVFLVLERRSALSIRFLRLS